MQPKVPKKENPASDANPKAGIFNMHAPRITLSFSQIKQKMRSYAKKNALLCSCLVLFLLWMLLPDSVWAVKLEEQLETVNALTTGKVKTIGVTGATILGFVWAIFKGNPKLAGIIVALGIMMGFYLNWVSKGMTLS